MEVLILSRLVSADGGRFVKAFFSPTEADQYVREHYPDVIFGKHDRDRVFQQSTYLYLKEEKGPVGVIFRFPGW